MVVNPFFQFKNVPSQSYGKYSSASIDVKNGSPDPADFAMTRLLIHHGILRCDGWDMPMVTEPLCELPEPQKMYHRLVAVREKNKMASVGSSRKSLPSQRDVPRDFERYARVGEVGAES
jgi:hypothetical protein